MVGAVDRVHYRGVLSLRVKLSVWLVTLTIMLGSCAPGAARRPPAVPAPLEDAGHSPATPVLEGGPEYDSRPHYDPPKPPAFAYLRGDRAHRLVALTFDDGPDTVYTPQILDVLKQHRVKATFFLVGRRVQAHPDIVRRMVRDGHELANHSWSHAYLPKKSYEDVVADLRRTDEAIRAVTGQPVWLFRPPYGSTTGEIARAAERRQLSVVLWNVDSLDWKKGQTQEDVAHNVLPNVRNGSIILFHSAGGKGEDLSNTVRALPLIIRTLRGQGYRLVTVGEMLRTGKPRPGQW